MIGWYILAFFSGCLVGILIMGLMAGSKINDREFVRMYKDKETDKVVYIKHSLGVDLEVRDATELEAFYADNKPIRYIKKQREQMGTDKN